MRAVYSYIIVSVAAGKPQEMTSWRLLDDRGEFQPEPLMSARAPLLRQRSAVSLNFWLFQFGFQAKYA